MERMLNFFAYQHLEREDLQAVSRRFHDLAHELVDLVPQGPERTVALRKLLESKDAAVRAVAIPEIADDEARRLFGFKDADRSPPPRPEPSSPIRKG